MIKFQVKCAECSEVVSARWEVQDEAVVLVVEPHTCQQSKILRGYFGDVLRIVGSDLVTVEYRKKDGEWRTLNGHFIPQTEDGRSILFNEVDGDTGEYHLKKLLRVGIETVEKETKDKLTVFQII